MNLTSEGQGASMECRNFVHCTSQPKFMAVCPVREAEKVVRSKIGISICTELKIGVCAQTHPLEEAVLHKEDAVHIAHISYSAGSVSKLSSMTLRKD